MLNATSEAQINIQIAYMYLRRNSENQHTQ